MDPVALTILFFLAFNMCNDMFGMHWLMATLVWKISDENVTFGL